MERNIFISYKYNDSNVHGSTFSNACTVRDYVDRLQTLLDKNDYINKGEPDNVDLSEFSKERIRQELSDMMFPSAVTIIMISPDMKEGLASEKNQWIPWEISYSLRTKNRNQGKSYPNAMLAVVLPDKDNSYSYYIEENICSGCNAKKIKINKLFPILQKNMFNAKNPEYKYCCHHKSHTILSGESGYIASVKWNEFIVNINGYIKQALYRQRNRANYAINTKLGN